MTTNQFPDPNSLLTGGAPYCKFETVGTVRKGTVVNMETAQQTDYDTGAPLVWEDGKPKLQVIVTLATDERDPDIPGDDGERRLFIKGGMLSAFRAALRAVGAKGLNPGDLIAVQYTGDGTPSRRGLNPPKQYACQVKPGAGPLAAALEDDPTDAGVAVQDLL